MGAIAAQAEPDLAGKRNGPGPEAARLDARLNGSAHAGRGERIGVCKIEASAPQPDIDFADADEWHILVTLDEVPRTLLKLPSPGAGASRGLFEAAVTRHADPHRDREQLIDALRQRLGAPRQAPPTRLSCSVIVCTRRPQDLARVLRALDRLDPAPDEVIVVDNDPGPAPCRDQVERAGARYVREDRCGLDNARRAGLAIASGDLVAFTDDDCAPAATWLRPLPELFEDPLVGAVTGPGFAATLATSAQRSFEHSGGFTRGLRRRVFDWTRLSPARAGTAGAGANMVFRRSVLDELGDVFPPELDAGTPTQSGGDMYALYRVLAAGYRVVYDPGVYVFHEHRRHWDQLERAIRGYGIGFVAVLTKILIEERDLGALRALTWLLKQYRDAVLDGLTDRASPAQIRIAWDYVRGGLRGPSAWREAVAQLGSRAGSGSRTTAISPRGCAASGELASPCTADTADRPLLSVVIPTADRPCALANCLEALAHQTSIDAGFEVIVVDDAPSSAGVANTQSAAEALPVSRIETHGAGAAGARNAGAAAARGELLLFLDDDLVPACDLLERHLECHRSDRERIVIGSSPPRPAERTRAALASSLWWEDHLRMKRETIAMTFMDIETGNMSVPRRLFERLGGFDVGFGALRREDWEWGARALRAGVEVVHAPAAIAEHRFSLDTRGRLDAAYREGQGDALLIERHPDLRVALPFQHDPRAGNWIAKLLLRRRCALRLAATVLDVLERLGAGPLWMRLFGLASEAAHYRGFAERGGSNRRRHGRVQGLAIELDSDAPIPPPGVAVPPLELRLRGRVVGRLAPRGRPWGAGLAADIADELDPSCWQALSGERPRRVRAEAEGLDLSDIVVFYGPAREHGDDRHREAIAATGARVEVATGSPADHWAALDRCIRTTTASAVATPLPGACPSAEWLAPAVVGLSGERVAIVVGDGLASRESLEPLDLYSRRGRRSPYPFVEEPIRYLAVAPHAYRAIGGWDLSTLRLGPYGPLFDFIERALDAGYVVGQRATPGLAPAPYVRKRRHATWLRWQARGGLVTRRARQMPVGEGLSFLLRHGLFAASLRLCSSVVPSRLRWRHRLGTGAAFIWGTVLALRADPGGTDRQL